jgi:hypothetical protein
VERYWVPRYLVQVPRYLLLHGTAATLAYCTNFDDKWGWFLEQLAEWKLAGETEEISRAESSKEGYWTKGAAFRWWWWWWWYVIHSQTSKAHLPRFNILFQDPIYNYIPIYTSVIFLVSKPREFEQYFERKLLPYSLLSNGYLGRFPMGIKRPGREANHLLPSSAKIEKGGAIPPFFHVSSRHSA